ncbi:S-layer homology domain-containing protein [Oscillospiraceae bacterium 44-5]
MRNLKRALSLTLASVMLLGMMVVGSSAAGYPDVAEDDNVEAIEVVQSVGVMVGDENGNFRPGDSVSRAEMAVVMGKLLNLDYNYYEAICPFTDVAGVYDWARGWVGAAAANGIVSGRGDGIYDPGATVTAVEAASMMMRALGYFKYQNDYADGFEVSTVRLGTTIGIFDGVGSSASEPMTRNQVAQMVLNALQSAVVEPDGNTINLTTPDGTVYTGKVNYVSVTSDKIFASAISTTRATSVGSYNDGWIVELGERLYDGKLELVNDDIDVFGRPARTWKYNGGEVGTYAKKELLVNGGTYTATVSGRDLYELLGQTTIRDNDLDSYLDGAENGVAKTELVRSNTKAVNDSARGVLTEVYLDNDNDRITIVSINTYLAKANSDYSSESETLSLTVYNSASGISKLVDLEDVASIANIKRDDWVLVNWADASKEAENKTVVDMMDVEILTDRTVTRFSMDNEEDNSTYPQEGTRIKSITTDGTEYKNNVNAYYKATTLNDYNKDLLVDKTYNIYLDQYGNFIGAELYSGKDQYVFITGYDRPESSIAVSTATANAIFTDGTMKNIKVNVKSTNENIASRGDENYTAWAAPGQNHEEMWYSYTLRDDIYTLTPAERYTYQQNDNAADATIDTSNVRLVPTGRKGTGYSYGEDESAYITVNMGDVDRDDDYLGIDEVTGIYTGIQEVKLVYGQNDWVHAVYDEDSFIIAAVVLGEAEGIADNYAYILGKTNAERYEDGVHYWEFEAIMGGKKQTMTVEDRFNNTVTKLKAGTIQELVLNADGNVVTIRDLPNSRTSASSEIETATVSGGYESDKIYTNFDFISTEGDSQDHADYNAYLIDVGGNGFGLQARYGAAALGSVAGMNGSATPYNANLYYTDIALSGRSLHYGAHIDTNDMGLLFAKEAPAFISREINNERKVYSYGSVAEAFSALQDADRDPSTNSSSGDLKQFSGIVAAVLDTKGVAQWVFFYDNTPVNGKDEGSSVLTGNVTAANGEPIRPCLKNSKE